MRKVTHIPTAQISRERLEGVMVDRNRIRLFFKKNGMYRLDWPASM